MPSLGFTTIEIDCERPASAVTLPFRFTPAFKGLGAHSDFGHILWAVGSEKACWDGPARASRVTRLASLRTWKYCLSIPLLGCRQFSQWFALMLASRRGSCNCRVRAKRYKLLVFVEEKQLLSKLGLGSLQNSRLVLPQSNSVHAGKPDPSRRPLTRHVYSASRHTTAGARLAPLGLEIRVAAAT